MRIKANKSILRRRSIIYLCLLVALHSIISCEGDFLRGSNTISNAIDDAEQGVGGHAISYWSSSFPEAAIIPLHAKKGSHHVHLYIGSPPQRQVLILDTGSRLTAFTCKPCLDCGKHVSPMYFDPDLSTTITSSDHCKFDRSSQVSGKCEFVQKFTEGSTLKAYEVEDVIWLGTNDKDKSIEEHMKLYSLFTFGCLKSEGGLFLTQYADGIMGVAKSADSFFDALYQSGAIPSSSFSLCMSRNGGYLSLGGTSFSFPDNHHLEKMQFIESDYDNESSKNFWYAVEIKKVYLGSVLISNQNIVKYFNSDKGSIIDSGTSDTYLPEAISYALKAAWQFTTGFPFSNNKEEYTFDKFNSLPSLIIILKNGYEWRIEPSSYMEELGKEHSKLHLDEADNWSGTKMLTARIYPIERIGCVLGANAMFGHDILFEKNRIGIARANCNMS